MSLPLETDSSPSTLPGQYRALSPWAVASVVVGALSIVTAFHWLLAMVPLAGIALGWRALRNIRDASAEWSRPTTSPTPSVATGPPAGSSSLPGIVQRGS